MTDITKMMVVDNTLPIEQRVDFLRHCDKMYANGISPISDAEYDREYYNVCEYLEEHKPDHEYLNEVGGVHMYGTEIAHAVLMGSLSKCLDHEQFVTWFRKTYPNVSLDCFVLQHKIDGLSLGLTYENGILIQALTRGDGEKGIDVTNNAKYVAGVRKTIPEKKRVEVRGECYKNRQDFYKRWHKSVGGRFANPRNFAAGSINQKDVEVTKERGLDFVAYEVVQLEFTTEKQKMEFLERNGFPTLRDSTKWTKIGVSRTSVAKAAEIYMNRIDRKKLPYDIDGVVFKLDDIKKAKAMGSVAKGRKPKSNRAIKFPAEESSATPCNDVEVNVGRTGKICPVGIVTPVELGGAMIGRVSLHNYGWIRDNDFTIGSEVIIAKKGDIIPQVIKITKRGTGAVTYPSCCPSCKEPLFWTKSQSDLYCDNYECIAQLNAKIENWFKKIGVKGIGEGTISKLTDQNLLEWEGKPIIGSLQEMYYMLTYDRRSEHPFRKYEYLKEFFGEKTYENIIKSVESVKEVPIHTFIEALGISRIGSMAKDITDIAPTIKDISKLTVAEVSALSGFGSVKAQSFVTGWALRQEEIRLLAKHVKPAQVKASSNKFAGKRFCFTGKFSSAPRKELEALVVDHGGKCGSVGKDTILVWDEAMTGGKYDKAIQLSCEIITEDDFNDLVEA